VIVIHNPAAAGGRLGRQWESVDRRLHAAGLTAPRVATRAPGHAAELAARAVTRDGVRTVVVAGGDGTLTEAVEGLVEAGTGRLAILPLGTGNDAARTLGIPLNIDAAARLALAGRPRAVDVIRVGERYVLNAIGIGLTADINRRAARIKYIRGIAVYLVTAVISMLRYRTPPIRLVTPDDEHRCSMTIVAIHNGPTTGGGFRLTPRAIPDDGLLDVCLVPGVGVLGRIPRLLAGMQGTLARKRGTVELQASWVELVHDTPLDVHLDGNRAVIEPPKTRFEILRAAVEVMTPGE
jgi:diacylglycerol kinase (ATP)